MASSQETIARYFVELWHLGSYDSRSTNMPARLRDVRNWPKAGDSCTSRVSDHTPAYVQLW